MEIRVFPSQDLLDDTVAACSLAFFSKGTKRSGCHAPSLSIRRKCLCFLGIPPEWLRVTDLCFFFLDIVDGRHSSSCSTSSTTLPSYLFWRGSHHLFVFSRDEYRCVLLLILRTYDAKGRRMVPLLSCFFSRVFLLPSFLLSR